MNVKQFFIATMAAIFILAGFLIQPVCAGEFQTGSMMIQTGSQLVPGEEQVDDSDDTMIEEQPADEGDAGDDEMIVDEGDTEIMDDEADGDMSDVEVIE